MSHDATIAACPPPPHLAAFERGALDDAELVAVAEHVGRCERCQAALAALAGNPSDSLQRALKRLGRGADTARALDTKRTSASAPDAGTTGVFVPAPDPHVTRARAEEPEEPSATRDRGARPEDPAGTQARAPDARGAEPADGPREASAFGKFELLGKLGEGGMGVVYKARDPLKRAVALKLIKGLLTPTDRRRFAAEAEAVARIGHPNVVLIYDYGETDGQPYASLEFVPGGSLADRLRVTLPDHRSAAQVMVGICRGVQAAHDLNLVHRDLKPANVLVSGDPNRPLGECVPKVTDFGLAKFFDADGDDSRANAVMGDPQLHGPGTSRRARRPRPTRRRVRPRGHLLRPAHRARAVPRHDGSRDAETGARAGTGAAAPTATEGAPRPRNDLPEVLGERPVTPVRERRRSRRRTATLPERRTDPSSPGEPPREDVALGQAQTDAGRARRAGSVHRGRAAGRRVLVRGRAAPKGSGRERGQARPGRARNGRREAADRRRVTTRQRLLRPHRSRARARDGARNRVGVGRGRRRARGGRYRHSGP